MLKTAASLDATMFGAFMNVRTMLKNQIYLIEAILAANETVH